MDLISYILAKRYTDKSLVEVDALKGGTTGQTLIKKSNNDFDFGFKDTTDKVRSNSHALVESNAVYSAINQALSSIYTPRGDLTCAELTSALLTDENVGNVYQMSDSGTTSALFIQGAGQTISVNDNVGIIKAGADTYLFNLMGNAFDLHDYQKKDLTTTIESATTVEGALSALSTNKADKVSGATAGNLASLDANGNLEDSGKKVVDLVADGNTNPVTSNAVYDYPIDSITDNEHRPPTSNAVHDALQIVYEEYTGSSIQVGRWANEWSIRREKSGYRPISVFMVGSNSADIVWGIENYAISNGIIDVSGYASVIHEGETYTFTPRIVVTWLKSI